VKKSKSAPFFLLTNVSPLQQWMVDRYIIVIIKKFVSVSARTKKNIINKEIYHRDKVY